MTDRNQLRIAITGAGGQLGSALCRQWDGRATPLDRACFPLADLSHVKEHILSLRPDVLINCAAYTAVDKAEMEAEVCGRINAEAVGVMAQACEQIGARLVQISTDYVFGGGADRATPFLEDEPVMPAGVYACSKAAGERQAAHCSRHLVIRTCGLYGVTTKQNNFVETMLRLGRERGHVRVVDDQVCTPSYVEHVARAIVFLVESEQQGVFHVVNRGATTWHGFATEIFRQAGMQVNCEPISTAQYNAPAPRPAYSVLDTARYESLGGPPLPSWQDALANYLEARAKS